MTQAMVILWSMAVILVIAEVMTGSLYLLMIAIGIFLGSLLGFLHMHWGFQVLAAGIISFSLLALLRKYRVPENSKETDFTEIGQAVQIVQWINQQEIRVRYRGSTWDAECLTDVPSAEREQRRFVVVDQRGIKLIIDC